MEMDERKYVIKVPTLVDDNVNREHSPELGGKKVKEDLISVILILVSLKVSYRELLYLSKNGYVLFNKELLPNAFISLEKNNNAGVLSFEEAEKLADDPFVKMNEFTHPMLCHIFENALQCENSVNAASAKMEQKIQERDASSEGNTQESTTPIITPEDELKIEMQTQLQAVYMTAMKTAKSKIRESYCNLMDFEDTDIVVLYVHLYTGKTGTTEAIKDCILDLMYRMKYWWAENPEVENNSDLISNGNMVIMTTDHQIQMLLTKMAMDPSFDPNFKLVFANSADWHLLAQVKYDDTLHFSTATYFFCFYSLARS